MKRVQLLITLLVSVLMLSTSANVSAQKTLTVQSGFTGSTADTYATIGEAINAAYGTNQNVTIIVKEGTYKEKVSYNQNGSGRKVVLASEFFLDGDATHIGKTIINGSGVTQRNTNDALVATYGNNGDTSYFKLIGVTIDSASQYGLDITAGQVSNCILKNSGSIGTIPFFFRGTKIKNVTVFNNIGVSIFAFQGVGSEAVDARNWLVENSTFYNNKALSQNSSSDNRGGPWTQTGIGAIIWSTSNTTGTLSNNIFYNNNGDNIITSGGDRPTDTLNVFNNVFYKNNTKTAYFINWWGNFGRNNYTSRWVNNIIDNNYTKATNNSNSEFSWGDGGSNGKPQNYIIKNNLLYTEFNTNRNQPSNFSSTFTFDYDSATNIIGSAIFKDTANLDFALLPKSPGIGAGNNTFASEKDYNGAARPNPTGSKVDMGAVESILSMPTPSITSVQKAVIGGKKANKINFSIYSNPKVDSVIIYRSTASKDTAIILSSAGTYSLTNRKDTVANASVFTDTTGIANSTKYYYTIKAFKQIGSLLSQASAVDSVTTSASTSAVAVPTSVTPADAGRSSVSITWTSSNIYTGTYSTTRTKYYIDIYKGTSASNFSLLTTIDDTTNNFVDKTTYLNTTYYYYLVNKDANGVVSDSSAHVSWKTPITTGAKKWYVDKTGGSDACTDCTTPTNAYKTLSAAMTNAVKGDTILALPGIYHEKIKINPGVTFGSKFLITGDTSFIRSTVIDTAGSNTGSMVTYAAFETNGNPIWTQFVGLTFTHAPAKGKYVINTQQQWQKFASFQNCLFTNNGYTDIANVAGRDANQDFIYMQFQDSTLIENSVFENNNGLINFGGSGIVLKNNIFRNNNTNLTKSNNVWCETGLINAWANGLKISGNIFYNNGMTNNNDNWQFFIMKLGGNSSDSTFITNNTFYRNNATLIAFNSPTPITHITNNIFYNNLLDFFPNNVTSDFYVKNNASTSKIEDSRLSNISSIAFSNNLQFSSNLFTDTTLFTIDPSSILINSGTNTFGTKGTKTIDSKDIYGNPRPGPAGTNSDIGAVESTFGISSPVLSSLDGANKSVVVKWKKPINGTITGYEIFRSTSSIPSTTSSATFVIANADSLFLIDTALVNLTKYYYRVRAYSGTSSKSYSAFSNELFVKPNTPPTGVDTAIAYPGPRSVAVKWADTSSVKRKYNVYRGIDKDNLDKVASAVDTTYYIDNTAVANTKYFYGVKVVDSVGAASPISKLTTVVPNNIWVIDTAGKSSNNGSTGLPIKSIQFAIDNGNPGDTILINNGTYYENLQLIKKTYTLIAKNKGKVTISPLDPAGSPILKIQDQGDWNVTNYSKAPNKIIGITFSGSTFNQWNKGFPSAVEITYNSNPIFEACTISNNTSIVAILIDQSAPEFRNSLIINNTGERGAFYASGGQDSTRPRTKVARFVNSIIYNNSFLSRYDGNINKAFVIFNSILSNNGYDNSTSTSNYKVVGSVVDNIAFANQSATNVLSDPQFNNASNNDYSLSNFSPALGRMQSVLYLTGSNNEKDTLKALTYDYNNISRPLPVGTNGDAGAFENKYSIPAPQISRLQKTGTAITITWAKTDSTVLTGVKIYRDTIKTSLDTIAALATVDLTTKTISDVLPDANKEYFYAIRATVGTGANAVNTGLSNIKSSKDTIFVPALNFIIDTASIKIRAASRQGNGLGQSVNLVKLAADAETALPKLIVYSQEFRQIDSTKRYANDSLTAINLLPGSGVNKIKLAINKTVLIAKGKNDYMQLVSAMNVNGDDEFDLVGIYRNSTSLNQQAHIAYLTNNNLNLTLDTVRPPTNFFNPNVNAWNQSTNLSYKWDQKTFQFNDNATNFGQNIESAAEFMDGNFDGKEELIVTLQQVKWEPNPTLNYGNNTSIYQTSSSIRPVKFVDINNDGIPDIFAMTNWPWSIGLGQVNGNPMVVFVSNKKDGKFYMYLTGINVDWGASLYFGDFKNSRTTQVLTRVNGGNYKVYDFDKNYSATSAEMQVNGVLNDGKIAVGDLNNDGYPDVVTIDNSNNFIAYLNSHRGDFEKRSIGQMPFQSNASWSAFNLKMLDLNQDGAKDLMWFEGVPESDGNYNWNSNNFYVRTWLQEVGDQKRTAPAKISASDIKVSNNGYNVKVQWTPSKDAIDPYIFANVKVDTLDTYKSARINNAYNYRQGNPAIPIVLDRVYARNYPDSLTFNDVNLTSKKPYYVKVQMVNQEGQASDFAEKVFSPKDPLASIDNAIPGLQNARFAWGDFNNDALLDLAVMGQSDNGNITKVYQNTGSAFVDLNLTNRAYRYGDIKWVDLNNDGWLDVAMIGQPGAGVGFQVLINNKGVFEVKTPTSVAGLKYSNMAFGDYDNNGTLDMFTSGQDAGGNAHSYLYKNDGLGNFTIVTELNDFGILPNMYDADARFIDYDLDGDLDLVYSGTDQNNNPAGGVRVNTILDPKLTTNNYGNGNFNNGYTYNLNTYNNDCQCNLGLAMKAARFDIGDIDGDGDLDIVEIGLARKYTGQTFTDNPQLVIIRNQTKETKNAKFGNYFSYGSIYNISATILDSIYSGDVKLVDFNNDGLLDITVTGLDKVDNPVTRFYLNQGGFGNFTLSNNAMIPQYSKSAISWGDANGDGSMDLVISGNKLVGASTSIFLNDQGTNTNKAPTVPQNLTFIDQGQGRVLLQWDASTDDHTNPDNLYYNLKLGTKPGLSDLRVIQVNPITDKLLTPNTSLIGSTKYYIELPPGAYYWSVQAVDGNYSSSKFAENQKIVLRYPWQFVNQGGIVDSRIQPLENPAFAWADVNNTNVFDFLYLGTGNATNDQNNTPVGLYRNIGAKFVKLKNDSTQTSGGFKGTGFRTDLSGIKNAQIKWVDFDNDSKLDLVVAGDDVNNGKGRLVAFRNRGNYKFENVTYSLFNGTYLASPKIEFIDLDNNGFKDFVYTGVDDQGLGQFKFIGLYKDSTSKSPAGDILGYKAVALKNNLDVLLTSSGISNVNLAVGDLNKDLKPDFAILYDDDNGRRKGEVYNNTSDTSNNITFIKSSTISLPILSNSTLDLIDYNNDGLLDLALSGTSQATGQIFRIYQNKWLDSAAKTIQFVQSNSTVLPFENGQTTWGDINSDGYPDIIFSGSRAGKGKISAMALADPSTVKVNGILKYNELPTFPFGDYSVMRPSLGDFSGKKVLDLVLVGTEKVTDPIANTSSNVSSFKILKNVRALSALVKDTSIGVVSIGATTGSIKSMSTAIMGSQTLETLTRSNSVRGFADSTIAVADSNYVENAYGSNNAPTSPKIDSSTIISRVDSVNNKYLVRLNWKAASDDNTPSSGLTYAVSIGTKSGLSDVLDPNASLITGTRKTPDAGNAGKNSSITVILAPGIYYWSVQAIDASNAGSKFSGTKIIQVNANRSLVERSAPYDILLNTSTESNFFLKQNDSSGIKYALTALDNDSTAVLTYSIVTDTASLFNIDASNVLRLKKKPTAALYSLKLRVVDNYGINFDKIYTFQVIQAPSKLLVNGKDTSYFYYNKTTADSAKLTLQLNATYDPVPAIDPVLKYSFVTGVGGDNNGLFDLGSSILINKRKLNDADTIKLRVAATDVYGLSVERIIYLINTACPTKPSLTVKPSATACLPLVVNLTDSLITNGTAKGLTFAYFTDVDATNKVVDPTKVTTSGTYYIKAYDTTGCGIAKPIVVNVASQPAAPTITAASACQNQPNVTIGYTAPSSKVKLVWYGNNATGGSPSTSTPSFNTSAATTLTYYVGQADTAAGCYSDRVKLDIVVKPAPIAPTISRDTAGNLVSSVSTDVTWYKDNALVSSAATFKPSGPGSYTVKTTSNGCSSLASNAYYYIVTDLINLSSTEYIKLAPNPFVNFLNFDFLVKGYQKLNIDVFETTTGTRIISKQGVYAGSRLSFAELSAGVYIFKVTSSDGKLSYQFKMVKL